MQNNLFFAFIVELLRRVKTKKPKFFIYLQYGISFLGAVTGIPAFLEQYHIVLPPAIEALENKYIGFFSIGFLIATQLTTQSTINSISKQGPVNKQTDPARLPFTAAVEVKEAIKEGKPKEIDPWTPPAGDSPAQL